MLNDGGSGRAPNQGFDLNLLTDVTGQLPHAIDAGFANEGAAVVGGSVDIVSVPAPLGVFDELDASDIDTFTFE